MNLNDIDSFDDFVLCGYNTISTVALRPTYELLDHTDIEILDQVIKKMLLPNDNFF